MSELLGLLSMENKLTLLVCSNRQGVIFSDIWRQVIHDKILNKIILVTQRKANLYKNHQSKVVHIKLTNIGRSNAINRGLQEIRTELVGLTDDDCYLHKNWVSQAAKILTNPSVSISMVYGQTLAYQPKKNKGKQCPCTFTKKPNSYTVVSHIGKHWIDVGFDNNAVIKKSVFEEIGGYKWWLGPGSIGKNAEDAEFILRALISKHKIAYNPSMIVYHNKWLTKKEWNQAMRVYLCGGVASYGFYGFQGVQKCQMVVNLYIRSTFQNIIHKIREYVHRPVFPTFLVKEIFAEVYFLCWGLIIAILFAKIVPIPFRENVVKFTQKEY